MQQSRSKLRIGAVIAAMAAAAATLAAAGTAVGTNAAASPPVLLADTATPTCDESCAECAPPPSMSPTPDPTPPSTTPEAATPETTTPETTPGLGWAAPVRFDPTSPAPRDRVNFGFLIWIDKDLKPSIDEKKVVADPPARREAIDNIKVGVDRRNDCYTLTFDGPTTLECEETTITGGICNPDAGGSSGNVRVRRVSVEEVKRDDGETVKRFVYRVQRMNEKGYYDIQLACTIPPR